MNACSKIILAHKAGKIDESTYQRSLNRFNQIARQEFDQDFFKLEIAPTPEVAEQLMGPGNYFGINHVEQAFGFKYSKKRTLFGTRSLKEGIEYSKEQKETLPPISFTMAELKRAKELRQFLVLRMDTAPDGQPLTINSIVDIVQPEFYQEKKGKVLYDAFGYHQETFFTTETPQLEWALTTLGVVHGSLKQNYLAQTDILADYLQNQVFIGKEMPPTYQAALVEWQQKRPIIETLTKTNNWQTAAEQLANFQLNQLCQHTPVEAIYDILLHFQVTNQRILEDTYTWTNARDSDGGLVLVGGADSEGANVLGNRPGYSNGRLGVVFSRSR